MELEVSYSQEPTIGPYLSQMNLVHILTHSFFMIQFHIIVSSVP